MTLFRKKKKKPTALEFSLNIELNKARTRKATSFFYPLEDHEISRAMAWGIRNRVAIEPSHRADSKIYYKFYGYSMI